jgi:hypothetical protein
MSSFGFVKGLDNRQANIIEEGQFPKRLAAAVHELAETGGRPHERFLRGPKQTKL